MRKKLAESTAFKNWINDQGVVNLTKVLGVQEATVRYWRRGESVPRPHQMKKIVQLSRGAVTYENIIEEHLSSPNWKR